MPNVVLLRQAVLKDVEAIHAIEQARIGALANTPHQLTRYLQKIDSYGIVAEVHYRVVGHLLYTIDIEKQRILIRAIGVHPDFRRQGIGSRLVSSMVGRKFHQELPIYVVAQERNLPVQLLLKKHGFLWIETQPSNDPNDALYLFIHHPQVPHDHPQPHQGTPARQGE